MRKQAKDILKQYKRRYQALLYLLLLIPSMAGFGGAVWLAYRTGTAMGLVSGVPVATHPHGNLWFADMFVLAVGGLSLGGFASLQLITLVLCKHHGWSWSEAKQARKADRFPPHWYRNPPHKQEDSPTTGCSPISNRADAV